jgi:hypothetical protein
VNYRDLIVDPLNQELVQNRGNATIDMNPIVTKNNTTVTLHLNDEKYDSERLAPYGELQLHCTSILKTEYGIKLMTAPSSMSILEIGLPSMWPKHTTASCAGSTPRASRTRPPWG